MKRQRRIKSNNTDRLLLTCSKETGEKIRMLADKKGLTISHFMATIIEPAIDKMFDEECDIQRV